MMKRGDIHYIMEGNSTGAEMHAGRPAIIVSNDKYAYRDVVEVVFLTTKPRMDLPTHVIINSAHRVSTAVCEQITSVSTARLGDYVGTCTASEMEELEEAIKASLGLEDSPNIDTFKESKTLKDSKDAAVISDLREHIKSVTVERDLYKSMYDRLMQNILDRR